METTQTLGGLSLGGWIGVSIFVAVVFAIFCSIITFIVVKKMFLKQIKENPPITERMIRTLYSQVGRSPSDLQVKKIIAKIYQDQNKKK